MRVKREMGAERGSVCIRSRRLGPLAVSCYTQAYISVCLLCWSLLENVPANFLIFLFLPHAPLHFLGPDQHQPPPFERPRIIFGISSLSLHSSTPWLLALYLGGTTLRSTTVVPMTASNYLGIMQRPRRTKTARTGQSSPIPICESTRPPYAYWTPPRSRGVATHLRHFDLSLLRNLGRTPYT